MKTLIPILAFFLFAGPLYAAEFDDLIEIDTDSYNQKVSENGVTASFTVQLKEPSTLPVIVEFAVSDTAIAEIGSIKSRGKTRYGARVRVTLNSDKPPATVSIKGIENLSSDADLRFTVSVFTESDDLNFDGLNGDTLNYTYYHDHSYFSAPPLVHAPVCWTGKKILKFNEPVNASVFIDIPADHTLSDIDLIIQGTSTYQYDIAATLSQISTPIAKETFLWNRIGGPRQGMDLRLDDQARIWIYELYNLNDPTPVRPEYGRLDSILEGTTGRTEFQLSMYKKWLGSKAKLKRWCIVPTFVYDS